MGFSGGVINAVAQFAKLGSMDVAKVLYFSIAPTEHTRDFGANWVDAGVAQASPQPQEYKDSQPEERVLRVTFDAFRRPLGVKNDIEKDYETLKEFTRRVPGKRRSHKLVFSHGKVRFKCVLVKVGMPVRRVAENGGALQAIDCDITLREIP
jgi:hypothetical protein